VVERRRQSNPIAPLLYWAQERESIRKLKASGNPPPWTTDPILQKYRFCNVRRIDDRVSQWLLANVLNSQADFDDMVVFIKWVAVCRWVNWPPTLEAMMDQEFISYFKIDLKSMAKLIEIRKKADIKSWTGAYIVRAPSRKKYPGVSKSKFVLQTVVGALTKVSVPLTEAIATNTARAVWEVLCSVPNWGSFMSGQVVADLSYTPLLGDAYDLFTWAPQGPGSRRGFNRLLGRPLKAKIVEDEWLGYLQDWREQVEKATAVRLNLMDLQNCLCEVDKYIRVKNGEGRPRSTYKSETAYK
jgi:hypothetical protein